MAAQVRFPGISSAPSTELDIMPVLSHIYINKSLQKSICAISLVLQRRPLGLTEGKWLPQSHTGSMQAVVPGIKPRSVPLQAQALPTLFFISQRGHLQGRIKRMEEEMQCLKLSEGTTVVWLLLCTPVTLSLKGTKEQTPLMLCDESRGKSALRETAGLSPAAGPER